MAKTNFKSVDEYIASQPEAAQAVLKQVRSAIRRALPKASEVISYQIPTYNLYGDTVIYFAGWKQHFSLYPVSDHVVAAFKGELSQYKIAKATVRFSLSEPVPAKLIERVAKFRAKELAGKAKTSRK